MGDNTLPEHRSTIDDVLSPFRRVRDCILSRHLFLGTGEIPVEVFSTVSDADVAFSTWMGKCDLPQDDWRDWRTIREFCEYCSYSTQYGNPTLFRSTLIHKIVRSVIEQKTIERLQSLDYLFPGVVQLTNSDESVFELPTAEWVIRSACNDLNACMLGSTYPCTRTQRFVDLMLGVYSAGGMPCGWSGELPFECDGRIDGGDGKGGMIVFMPNPSR